MSEHEIDPAFADQVAALKRHFDPVMTEPIPARMYLRQPAWIGITRAAIVFVVGVAVGVSMTLLREPVVQPAAMATAAPPLAIRAARAHAVYAPEVRHPVEVDATQQDHLVKWLSKRLGLDLRRRSSRATVSSCWAAGCCQVPTARWRSSCTRIPRASA